MYRIGIDTGGTFTDCVIIESKSGSIKRYKTPSTPQDYSDGVINVLKIAAIDLEISLNELLNKTEIIIHGTTITTNLILSREGKDVGLITTKGFRDVIEQWWKEEKRYDMLYPPPNPPCPRWLRREIDERIDFSGEILKEINKNKVEEATQFYKQNDINSIAVSLKFSLINPIHEQ